MAVINQAAADRFYPDEDPLGRPIKLSVSWGFDDDPVRTIVGVVGDVRTQSATAAGRARPPTSPKPSSAPASCT